METKKFRAYRVPVYYDVIAETREQALKSVFDCLYTQCEDWADDELVLAQEVDEQLLRPLVGASEDVQRGVAWWDAAQEESRWQPDPEPA